MKTAHFISTFEMYDKEESGIKPNTLRVSTPRTDRMVKEATHISISRGYTDKSFTREITDKTYWSGYWIISWNPNY